MSHPCDRRHAFASLVRCAGLVAGLPLLMASTCSLTGGDAGGGGAAISGVPTVTFVAPTSDRDIPAGMSITVTYSTTNAPSTVVAFYDIDGNDDEIAGIIADDLSGGTNLTFNFDTTGVSPGVYTIGVQAANSAGTTTQYARSSSGALVAIRVNGLPQPAVNSPSSDLEVLTASNNPIDVVFSCNDPENDVTWEVFFDTNRFVGDGVAGTIEVGTGNTDEGRTNTTVPWRAGTNLEGTYNVGVTCTDGRDSTVTAYAAGRVIVTGRLSLPTVEVTEPAVDRVVVGEESVTIKFVASSTEVNEATITVFLDTDNVLGLDDTEINLGIGLPITDTELSVSSAIIPDGVYFVGAFVELDGERNVGYAAGKLTVTGAGDLTISAPTEPITVKPGTDVTIAWNTNLPTGRALIDLALFTADSQGNVIAAADPDPLADFKELPVRPSSVRMDTAALVSGFYVAQVTLTPTDADGEPDGDPTSATTARIRVTTAPTVLWVGRIELSEDQQGSPPLGHFDGVVFEGVNFEDNAGSSLLGAPALLDLPLGGGFLIGARFAKPLFSNPNGVGAGEAYLIYSDISRINRRYSLNAVGAKESAADENPNALAGLRFSGLAFDQASEDINGDGQLSLFSEDVDGDGALDFVDEDIDGDGSVTDDSGSTFEDVDLDGAADRAEDGFLGLDANGDGVVDNVTTRTNFGNVFNQYVNGALDVGVNEDRDQDGVLDAIGDATWGLTTIALLPDVEDDGLPELAFGFEFTDSLAADFRADLLGESEPPGFGTLTQPNQFERGGMVVIPSMGEPLITDPFNIEDARDENRVIQLDFVGQGFSEPVDSEAEDTQGVVPPSSTTPDNRPINGHDVFPYVRDIYDQGANPISCDPNDELELAFTNNIAVDFPARARFDVVRTPPGGGNPQTDTEELIATRGTTAFTCIDVGGDTVRIEPQIFPVAILDPDVGADPTVVDFADASGMAAVQIAGTGGFAAYGVSGDFGTFRARNADFSLVGADTCAVNGSDNCFETIVGPFYGFHYVDVAGMESPTHPLAYNRTLANPGWRLFEEFPALTGACVSGCGRVLPFVDSIQEGTAPGLSGISTGFYPGQASPPIGARILGRRAGDRFGSCISLSPADDNRVFVGAPRRLQGALVDAGAVYQFKMENFWASASDLAGVNEADVPKPHQYVIKEVGSTRPDGLMASVGPRIAMSEAIVYTGADAGDRLGESVVGILDFNGDARPDILMGAPGADGIGDGFEDSGAAYVIYRLPQDIEASVSLDKLELDPGDPNRLNGMLINGDSGDQLGSRLDGNCDLNEDGVDDIVLGNPLHGGGDNGEVVVVFGGPNLASPAGGFAIDELVDLGRAVRIQGAFDGDQVGFSVACGGDFTGDGRNDLIFSAPFATPRYDTDGDDVLDAPGLDLDRDGADDGLLADPEGAGLVYVITNMDSVSGTLSVAQIGAALQGFVFVGAKGGDNMGGGHDSKRLTRSQGLAYAGDINQDGRSDLLLSSILADPVTGGGSPKTNAGEVYLIYGFDEQDAEGFLNLE